MMGVKRFWVLITLSFIQTLSAQEQIDSLIAIEDVVVTAHQQLRSDALHQPQSLSVVSNEQLSLSHSSSLLEVLSVQVPGMFVTSRGVMGYGVSSGAAGAISIRGVGGVPTTSVLLLIDGKPQYMGLMGHPLADSYINSGVERVEVIRGPASLLYGSGAMGGVVNIITRKSAEESFDLRVKGGYGSYNTIQSGADVVASVGRFSLSTALSYNSTDGHRPNMQMWQCGARVGVEAQLSKRWSVALGVDFDRTNSSNPGRADSPIADNDARVVRGRVSLSVDNRFERTYGSLSLYCNVGRHHINDGYSPDDEPLDYRFNSRDAMWGATLSQSASLFRGNSTTFGADFSGFGGKTWNRYLDDGRNVGGVDKEQYQLGCYVSMRQSLSPKVAMQGGVRYSFHSHCGSEWVPQGAVIYSPLPELELRAVVSKGFRYPTLREMYLTPQQNPDLVSERLWNYELATSFRGFDGRLSLSLNLFLIDGDNRIESQMVDGRQRWSNSGEVRNYGGEAEVSALVAKSIRLNLSYSYLGMKYKLLSSPEHKLCFGAGYHRRRFSVLSSLSYVGGLYTQLPGGGSAGHKESFLLWDLRAETTLTRWMKMWLRVENLLDQDYEINRGFPMPGCTVYGGMEFLINSRMKR